MNHLQLGHAKFMPYQLTPYEKMKLELQETPKINLTPEEKQKAKEFIRKICHHQ